MGSFFFSNRNQNPVITEIGLHYKYFSCKVSFDLVQAIRRSLNIKMKPIELFVNNLLIYQNPLAVLFINYFHIFFDTSNYLKFVIPKGFFLTQK